MMIIVGETKDSWEIPKCILIENLGLLYPTKNSKKKYRYGIYECGLCGTNFKIRIADIDSNKTKSCGCYKKMTSCKNASKHNYSSKRLYRIWRGMKERTLNIKSKDYERYGGRGVTVCDEWVNDFVAFRDWALESGYIEEDKNLSIDRIDNAKGYYPDNCRWTTITIQQRNRGISKNNKSGYKGVYFSKKVEKFLAGIKINKKYMYLGTFKTVIEGALAYNNYIIENNLDGFILNIIPEEFKDIIPKRITRK